MPGRDAWSMLDDNALLTQCEVDTYRASGPGGQKRNKTSSAVRLRHGPSGLIVIAEESRSQHENKARALRRLRQAFQLRVREPVSMESLTPTCLADHPVIVAARNREGRLDVGRRDIRYWQAAGLVLDVLEAAGARVSDAAAALSISTGNLIDFLRIDDQVWSEANRMRARNGLKPLRD